MNAFRLTGTNEAIDLALWLSDKFLDFGKELRGTHVHHFGASEEPTGVKQENLALGAGHADIEEASFLEVVAGPARDVFL